MILAKDIQRMTFFGKISLDVILVLFQTLEKYTVFELDFSRKVGLLISRFSFPKPVQVPSRI